MNKRTKIFLKLYTRGISLRFRQHHVQFAGCGLLIFWAITGNEPAVFILAACAAISGFMERKHSRIKQGEILSKWRQRWFIGMLEGACGKGCDPNAIPFELIQTEGNEFENISNFINDRDRPLLGRAEFYRALTEIYEADFTRPVTKKMVKKALAMSRSAISTRAAMQVADK